MDNSENSVREAGVPLNKERMKLDVLKKKAVESLKEGFEPLTKTASSLKLANKPLKKSRKPLKKADEELCEAFNGQRRKISKDSSVTSYKCFSEVMNKLNVMKAEAVGFLEAEMTSAFKGEEAIFQERKVTGSVEKNESLQYSSKKLKVESGILDRLLLEKSPLCQEGEEQLELDWSGQQSTVNLKDEVKSPVSQKSEEQLESDFSSLRAFSYLHKKHKLSKKSEKFRSQAQKPLLKAPKTKLYKDSELRVNKWREMMLQYQKRGDALKTEIDELFKKDENAEKETKETLKQLCKVNNRKSKLFQVKEEVKDAHMLAEKNTERLLDETCTGKHDWFDISTNLEYQNLLRLVSMYRRSSSLLDEYLYFFENKFAKLQEDYVKCCKRKLELEKQKSCAFRKMRSILKKMFKLLQRANMSSYEYLCRGSRLWDRAADYDYFAETFLKQQYALRSKVSSQNDSLGVQEENFPGQYKLFFWKKQGLSRSIDQPSRSAVYQNRNLSHPIQIPLDSWSVSLKEVVRNKKSEISQSGWKAELRNEATKVQTTQKNVPHKMWRVSCNIKHSGFNAHPKEVSTTDTNNISVEPLKM